mmetsp:Transcript_14162/g.25270  ORF Transcript_14162/g.25270 Transcript_14162/m.25270 type:complete len:218 (+) Transcript_14162:1288-1941(+)
MGSLPLQHLGSRRIHRGELPPHLLDRNLRRQRGLALWPILLQQQTLGHAPRTILLPTHRALRGIRHIHLPHHPTSTSRLAASVRFRRRRAGHSRVPTAAVDARGGRSTRQAIRAGVQALGQDAAIVHEAQESIPEPTRQAQAAQGAEDVRMEASQQGQADTERVGHVAGGRGGRVERNGIGEEESGRGVGADEARPRELASRTGEDVGFDPWGESLE